SCQAAAAQGPRRTGVTRWRSRPLPSLAEKPPAAAAATPRTSGVAPDPQAEQRAAAEPTLAALGGAGTNGANGSGLVPMGGDGAGPAAAEDGQNGAAPTAPRWALRDVSFDVRPGQLAAL